MRLEEVYDSDRKVARFRFAISIRAQIGSAGADEFSFSVLMEFVSSSITKAWARGSGEYRGVLQPPGSA